MPSEYACQPYEVIVYDYPNKKICHTLPNYFNGTYERHSNNSITGMRAGTRYDDIFFHKSFNNDTLYTIHKEKGVNPYAIIDLGKRKLPNEVIFAKDPRTELSGKILITAIYINQDCILFECLINNDETLKNIDGFICKYDITTRNLTYYSPALINDLDGGCNIGLGFLSRKIGYVVLTEELDENNRKSYLSSLDKSELEYPVLKDQFERIQKNREPDDNPLLLFIRTK